MAAPNVPTTVADIKARLACADEAEFCALERALAADPRKGVQQAVKTARRRLDAEAPRHDGLRRSIPPSKHGGRSSTSSGLTRSDAGRSPDR